MADRDTDLERIKQLIDIMKENSLVELQIEHGDDKIVLKISPDFVKPTIDGLSKNLIEYKISEPLPEMTKDYINELQIKNKLNVSDESEIEKISI